MGWGSSPRRCDSSFMHVLIAISTGECRVGYGRAVDSAVKQRSVLVEGLLPARRE
eukprot:COSAG05_NODE_166_length_15185_cov_10.343497_1_plen_54_part_10